MSLFAVPFYILASYDQTRYCIFHASFFPFVFITLFVVVVACPFFQSYAFLACAQQKKRAAQDLFGIDTVCRSWHECLAHTLFSHIYMDHILFGACFVLFGIFAVHKLRVTYKWKPIGCGVLEFHPRGNSGAIDLCIYGSQSLIHGWKYSLFSLFVDIFAVDLFPTISVFICLSTLNHLRRLFCFVITGKSKGVSEEKPIEDLLVKVIFLGFQRRLNKINYECWAIEKSTESCHQGSRFVEHREYPNFIDFQCPKGMKNQLILQIQ